MVAFRIHLSWCTFSLLFSCIHAGLDNFAIIRPFAVVDAEKLVSSFEPWNTFLPCDWEPAVPVDLLLCFSQDLAAHPQATQVTQAIIADFLERKHPWHHCFRSVQAVSANLTAAEDSYRPTDPVHVGNWVNGPNQQFVTMAHAFEQGTWGNYSAWFLMEMDCKARRSGWLTELLAEVEDRAPFAVLGSYYRGDLWDTLAIPPAIRLHINGNAVYNATNRLFQALLAELEGILATGLLTTAFDVELTELYLNSDLTSEQFGWVAGDSQVIGNYARVAMIDSYFGGEALVHGAWMYEAWDPAVDPVALVVSDFEDAGIDGMPLLNDFVQRLLKGHHPFREIVVVVQPGADTSAVLPLDTPEDLSFFKVERSGSAWLDWCKAPVSSPWFVYTNVYYDFGRRIDMLRSLDSHLPVLPFVYANCSYCTNFPHCVESLKHASSFVGQPVDRHFELSQMVFNTAARDAFCAAWQTWRQAPHDGKDVAPLGPTPDDYMAYLEKTNRTGLYSFVEGTKHGQRPFGIYHTNHCLGADSGLGCGNTTGNCSNLSFCNASNLGNASNMSSASSCEYAADELECSALVGCTWRPHFETCFNGTLPAVPKPPNFTLHQDFSLQCQSGLALPTFHLHNSDAHLVQFEVDVSGPFAISWSVPMSPDQDAELPLQPNPNFTASSPLVPGTMSVWTEHTAPHLLEFFEFVAVDVQPWSVSMSPNETIHGATVFITASAPIATHLALQTEVPLNFVSPVVTSDGWVSSADPDAFHLIAFDTSTVPPNVTNVTIEVRQSAVLPQGTVTRCYSLQLFLAPALTEMCNSQVRVVSSQLRSGSPVDIIVEGNIDDITSYYWAIDASPPSAVTSAPQATLQLPFCFGACSVSIKVTMRDSYGRSYKCSVEVTVNGASSGHEYGNATFPQCSSADFSDVSAAEYCLQVLQLLLPVVPDEARTMMKDVFPQMALVLHTQSTLDTNRLLSRFATLIDAVIPGGIDEGLLESFANVIFHLLITSPVDFSSTVILINAIASLLESSLQSMNMPGATNTADALRNTVFLTNLLEQTIVHTTCGGTLYSYTTAQSANGCINVSWGLQTRTSLPGTYGGFTLYPIQGTAVPSRVNVVLLTVSHKCNALSGVLQTTAQLHRLILIDPVSCKPISLSTSGPLWQAPLMFEVPPIQSPNPLPSTYPEYVVFVLQTNCIIMNKFGGPSQKTLTDNNGCSASAPAWLTGSAMLVPQDIMGGQSAGRIGSFFTQSSAAVNFGAFLSVLPKGWSAWWSIASAIVSGTALITGITFWCRRHRAPHCACPNGTGKSFVPFPCGKQPPRSPLAKIPEVDVAFVASHHMGPYANPGYV